MTSPRPTTDLRDKLARIVELEGELAGLPPKCEERASRIRMRLCEEYSDIVLSDPQLAMRKDIIGRLWRNCFYARIGELRNRIAREKRKKTSTMTKLEESLRVFLGEAIVLYRYLVSKYETKLLPPSSLSQSQSQASSLVASGSLSDTKGVVHGLHRMLIHLGDLLRYDASYGKAEKCYTQASKLAPGRGNPYNQLAVIAQLKETAVPLSCVSLYWYARALLATKDPFPTSNANLARLFEDNREWLKKHGDDEAATENVAAAAPNRKAAQEQARSKKSAASRRFLARFVDVHFDFFRGAVNKVVDEAALLDQMSIMLDKFVSLLEATAFGDSLLCKMVAINAFSAHRAKGNLGLLAKALVMQFGAALAQRVTKSLQKVVSGGQRGGDATRTTPSVRLLLPLLLTCDYLSTFQNEHLQLKDASGDSASRFCSTAVRAFWSHIIDVANLLNSLREGLDLETSEDVKLTEYENLRGFAPFQSFTERIGDKGKKEKDAYVTADEAAQVLELYTSSTQESTVSVVSTAASSEEENKLKVTCFFEAVNRFVDSPKSGTNRGLIGRDANGLYYFSCDAQDKDTDQADVEMDIDNGRSTVSKEAKVAQVAIPPVVANKAANSPGDAVMYMQSEDGSGPALLVPGALLLNRTEGAVSDTSERNAPPKTIDETEMKTPIYGSDLWTDAATHENRPTNAASSSVPGLAPMDKAVSTAMESATEREESIANPVGGIVEEATVKPMTPPPGLGLGQRVKPPPGFAGTDSVGPVSVSVPAQERTTAPLAPPGFGLSADPVQGSHPPMYMFGGTDMSGLRTANPFAAPSLAPMAYPGNAGSSLGTSSGSFGSSYAQQPNSHFLDAGRDSVEGVSLLDSSLLTSLWMEESQQKNKPPPSKNPFLT